MVTFAALACTMSTAISAPELHCNAHRSARSHLVLRRVQLTVPTITTSLSLN